MLYELVTNYRRHLRAKKRKTSVPHAEGGGGQAGANNPEGGGDNGLPGAPQEDKSGNNVDG